MSLPISWAKGTLPQIIGTGVTLGSGGVGTFDSDSIVFTQVSGQAAHVRYDFAEEESTLDIAVRVYFKTPAAWPSASANIVALNTASHSSVAMLSISGSGAPGQLRLLRTGGSTVSSAPNNTMLVDTWYRVELQLNGTNSRARAALFPADSETPLWTSTWQTHANYAVPILRVAIGAINSSPTVAAFEADEILLAELPGEDEWLGAPPIPVEPVGLQARLADLATVVGADVAELRREALSGKLVNPLGLSMWQAAVNGHISAPAKIVCLGDSNTEGAGTGFWDATWPNRLQALIRARKGISGGKGYVGSAPTTGAYVVSPPVARTLTNDTMGGWAIGGRVAMVSAAGSSIVYNSQVCDRIRVWYGKTDAFGGPFNILIDGEIVGSASSSSGGAPNSDGYYWDSAVLTRGPHVVSFVSPSGWIGIIDGVEFYDGDYGTGVRVFNGGHYGYSAGSFNPAVNTNMGVQWQHLTAVNPQLTILMLGTNDLLGAGTVAQYQSNLADLIDQTPATSSVLILMPPTRGDARTAPDNLRWNQMREAAAALATGRVSFLDLEHWWPSLNSNSTTWAGLMSDSVHLNAAGYETLAEVVTEHICAPIRR